MIARVRISPGGLDWRLLREYFYVSLVVLLLMVCWRRGTSLGASPYPPPFLRLRFLLGLRLRKAVCHQQADHCEFRRNDASSNVHQLSPFLKLKFRLSLTSGSKGQRDPFRSAGLHTNRVYPWLKP